MIFNFLYVYAYQNVYVYLYFVFKHIYICVCVRAVCETQCERQNFLRPSLSRFMAQVDDLPIAKCFR